jgi:xanthine dehydrogenase YagS FAD-binding subunit
MNVALTALEAVVTIREGGDARGAIGILFAAGKDSACGDGGGCRGADYACDAAGGAEGSKQVYLKLRDRASYEFALSSAAVVVEVSDGQDFATSAWRWAGWGRSRGGRMKRRRRCCIKPADAATFHRAAAMAVRDARPQSENGFKVELTKRCIAHALTLATQQA